VATVIASAYSGMLPPNPTLSLIQGATLLAIVTVLVLSSIDVLPGLRRLLLTSIAILHLIYVKTYASTYNLHVLIAPLLDVFIDSSGHASAMIDFTQIVVIYIIASYIYEKHVRAKQQERDITPSTATSPTNTDNQ